MMTRKVSANTMSSLRSMPGSCWGFLNSAKSVARCSWFAGGCSGGTEVYIDEVIHGGIAMKIVFHHRIISALHKGMAAQQSPGSHQCSSESAIALDRFHRVFRAGGHVAARRGERRRYPPLIKP